MDCRISNWLVGSMDFASIRSDSWVSNRIRLKRELFGIWRTAVRDGQGSLDTQTLKYLGYPASKGVFLAGLSVALVSAYADEQRFGNWYGEIDLASSTPVSISAQHHYIENDSSSTLWLSCTPPGWNGGPTANTTAEDKLPPQDQLRFAGLLMEHSSTTHIERELKPCLVEAKVGGHDVSEHIVRSQGLCAGSAVDAAQIDEWADILDLLTHPLSGEQPRITVHRRDDSKFTYVAPKRYHTSNARTWMEDTCRRMRKSEGRVTVPGPTYGVWLTQYTYDLFYEKKLVGTIRAGARSGANEVGFGCGGSLSVTHRTDVCMGQLEEDAASKRDLESCRIAMRVDGGPPVEQEALCQSACFAVSLPIDGTDGEVVAAMLAGASNRANRRKGVKMRVSGPNDTHRRDFEYSLWGFDSAHGWVSSECAAAWDG